MKKNIIYLIVITAIFIGLTKLITLNTNYKESRSLTIESESPVTALSFFNKKSISASEFMELKALEEAFVVIDVRSPEEHKQSSIKGAILIPLSTLESRLDELDTEAYYVVHCRSGTRSARAQSILEEHGFAFVLNLEGDILAIETR